MFVLLLYHNHFEEAALGFRILEYQPFVVKLQYQSCQGHNKGFQKGFQW